VTVTKTSPEFSSHGFLVYTPTYTAYEFRVPLSRLPLMEVLEAKLVRHIAEVEIPKEIRSTLSINTEHIGQNEDPYVSVRSSLGLGSNERIKSEKYVRELGRAIEKEFFLEGLLR
jgi:hypothetical protein